ncbi:MAG: hypothetical protein IPH54_17915 [Rhodoferax sp.]|nr:hypothetical protein [Rhodoferax sp.]
MFLDVFLITRQPLSSGTLTAINDWRVDMYPACKASFDSWASAPYAFAVRTTQKSSPTAGCVKVASALPSTACFSLCVRCGTLWKSLLAQWSASSFAPSLVVIDRDHTAPRWPSITYVDAPQYDYALMDYDRALMQSICEREDIGLFISTYYTIPRSTPSVLLVLDMIPEIMGFDPTNPQWVGKRHAIEYAKAFLSISHSTERDLVRLYPASDQTQSGCPLRL